MKRALTAAVLAVPAMAMFGCATPPPRAYVDPRYHDASLASIHRLATPIPVQIDVHFLRNGEPMPLVDDSLRASVESALRDSGVFTPSDAVTTRALVTVSANDIADAAALVAGAARSRLVDDKYEFTCSYLDDAGHVHKGQYKHLIHSTVGRAQPPAGMTPTNGADAFAQVVQDAVLNFIQELQRNGSVPST